ncbi:hypothetical protein CHUAL_013546 [Chamberlinius hualienensis]
MTSFKPIFMAFIMTNLCSTYIRGTTTTMAVKTTNEVQIHTLESTEVWGQSLCSAKCLTAAKCDAFTIVQNNDHEECRDAKYNCILHQILVDAQSPSEYNIENGTLYIFKNIEDTLETPQDFNVSCNVSAVFYDYKLRSPAVFCKEGYHVLVLDLGNLNEIKHRYEHIKDLFPDYADNEVVVALNLPTKLVILQNADGKWDTYKYNRTSGQYQKSDSNITESLENTPYKTAVLFSDDEFILISDDDSQCVTYYIEDQNESEDSQQDNQAIQKKMNQGKAKSNNGKQNGKKKPKAKTQGNKKTNNGNGNGNGKTKNKNKSQKKESAEITDDHSDFKSECEEELDYLKELSADGIEIINDKYYVFRGSKGHVIP